MFVGGQGGNTPAGRALQVALLDQVGLNHIFDGFALFTDAGGNVLEAGGDDFPVGP